MSLTDKQVLEIREEIERRRELLLKRLERIDEKKRQKKVKTVKEEIKKETITSRSNTKKVLKAAKTLGVSEEELRKLGLI